MAYRWDDRSGRFRDERGRYVSERAVRSAIDRIADHASEQMARASERLLAGEMSLASWQAEMGRLVKVSQLAATVIAHGGRAQMTPSRYGSAGRAIRDEYAYLHQFAEQIADGRQPLDRRLVSRAELYGQGARTAFERVRGQDQQRRGYLSCRNVLHAQESCSQCRAESRRGWVSIGELVPVGRRLCLSRCKCTVEYRREPAEAAA